VLRDDGITYHEYVTELSYLLFLKLAAELDVEQEIPPRHRWDALADAEDTSLLDQYKASLSALGQSASPVLRDIFEGSHTNIRRGDSLRRLIGGISAIDWYSAGPSGLGDIYEGLIEKNASESRNGAGQYFTPRALVEAIVQVCTPASGEAMYDPAAGTAGFLVSAGLHTVAGGGTPGRLFGHELVRDTQRMAQMNLRLHGLDGFVTLADSLGINADGLSVDLCITNPPFGVRGGLAEGQQAFLDYPTSNKQLAFLQHVYKSLGSGGRAAIVVPDNVLFEEGVATSIRSHLLDNYHVHTILRLPTGIFYATGVRTSVLFFSATGRTHVTWVYNLRGQNGFTKRRQLAASDMEGFIAAYGNDPYGRNFARTPSELFVQVFREQFAEADDRLDFGVASDYGGTATLSTDLMDTVIEELSQALESARALAQALREVESSAA
jgi:type I restriction enzyme M protein